MRGIPPAVVDEVVERALREDLAEAGDLTAAALFDEGTTAKGVFLSKDDGVLAGGELIALVYRKLDPGLRVTRVLADGTLLTKGRIFAATEGPVGPMLTAERTVLNLLQRLSGVATMARTYREKIRNFPACRVVDTRKTTPGLRALEKYAVRVGGCGNHRSGLHDAVMIKDNHVRAAGGVAPALARVRATVGHTVKIEVEVNDEAQALEAWRAGADIVMLDNMAPEAMKRCVDKLKGKVVLEASGGITLDTIGAVVKTGVDLISVGALTHSVRSLDLSFELSEDGETPS